MSKYVGKLKADNISCDISWSIVLRAPTYNPITRSCRLCLLEKYLIMLSQPELHSTSSQNSSQPVYISRSSF